MSHIVLEEGRTVRVLVGEFRSRTGKVIHVEDQLITVEVDLGSQETKEVDYQRYQLIPVK